MKFIETKTHGVMDYLIAALLIAAPWIFGFNRGGAETWLPVVLGIGTILYSLLTDYELGAWRKISMPTHLTIDLVNGLLLAASPWLFGFANYVWEPHLILGIIEIGASLFSKREAGKERTNHHAHRAAGAH